MQFKIEPLGDSCVIVLLFGEDIDMLCRRVRNLTEIIEAHALTGVDEIVPAYASLAVYYRPLVIGYHALHDELINLMNLPAGHGRESSRHFDLPVLYGGRFGPDLTELAELHGLSTDQIINLHCGSEYTVAMIGFTPGFPYLLGLPNELSTPRRQTPRHVVAAGSVGIGGSQTGVYSMETPGGWNIIGRTPIRLFQPGAERPSLLMAGDRVTFSSVDETKYQELKRQIDGGMT